MGNKTNRMHLVIDVGNTQIKIGVFEENKGVEYLTANHEELLSAVKTLKIKYPDTQRAIIASVGTLEDTFLLSLENLIEIQYLTKECKFPFKNNYSTPNTLGIDRMVLAAGAVLEYPNQNRLVIDVGTCITYDFIDENNNYLGGAISPGIRLRYESMNQKTAKLPYLTKEKPLHFIGNSTESCMHSGVVNGIALEIDGFIELYKAQYTNFITILTGGDSDFLAMRLKNTIFANSNFLLKSLNQTFQYNQND